MSVQENLTINEKKVLLALEALGSASPKRLEEENTKKAKKINDQKKDISYCPIAFTKE